MEWRLSGSVGRRSAVRKEGKNQIGSVEIFPCSLDSSVPSSEEDKNHRQ